ncbi:MAG: hypothetical protein EBZ48_10020 [Proteobacteria bacterium]|nr:hypothetical protein [Pseudomonadota bacterium]
MSAHTHNHAHEGGHSHAKQYGMIFGILVFLTVITVAASRVDFGTLNLVIAMLIASCKAGLVALFFMHLKHENPLTWLYALFPIVLLFILIGLVFLDEPFRTTPTGVIEKTPLHMPWMPGSQVAESGSEAGHH